MAIEYTLLMQKAKDGSAVKSSLTDFGFAVGEIKWPVLKIKEPARRDWPGEHGEDVFFPPQIKLEAYDLEVEFLHKGLRGADNLLSGTNLGKSGWKVSHMADAGGNNVTAQIQPWTLRKPYIKRGEGLGLTIGDAAASGSFEFANDCWLLKPGAKYTLSFTIGVGGPTDYVDVFLGKNNQWADMATDWKRLYLSTGLSKQVLTFTVKGNPSVGEKTYVVFKLTGMDWAANTGIELFDLKLEEGEASDTKWTPSQADVETGFFPQYWPAHIALLKLRNYLMGMDGDGTELKIYDPYWRRGRHKVMLQSLEDFAPSRSDVDETLAMKAVFRVCDPMTEIILSEPSTTALAAETKTDYVDDQE